MARKQKLSIALFTALSLSVSTRPLLRPPRKGQVKDCAVPRGPAGLGRDLTLLQARNSRILLWAENLDCWPAWGGRSPTGSLFLQPPLGCYYHLIEENNVSVKGLWWTLRGVLRLRHCAGTSGPTARLCRRGGLGLKRAVPGRWTDVHCAGAARTAARGAGAARTA
jgi:hypothetical protein